MSRTLLSCLTLGLASATLPLVPGIGPLVLAGLAGNVAGGLAGDLFKVLDKRVAERFLDGRSGIDENHHVVRALRLSQLHALLAVLKRFDQTRASLTNDRLAEEADVFSEAIKAFLDAEIKIAQKNALSTSGDLTTEEQAVRIAVLDELPDAFDTALAARRETHDESAIKDSVAQLRQVVERAVIAELRARAFPQGGTFPPLFISSFSGEGFRGGGWFDLFVRDAAAELKEGGEFERVWSAEQNSIIKAIVTAQEAEIRSIKEDTKSTREDTAFIRRSNEDILSIVQTLLLLQTNQATSFQKIPVIKAVVEAQQGSDAGDVLMQKAYGFLRASKIFEAEEVFSQIAEQKAARIDRDRKDAANAYKNLGAIAGLADPKRSLDAYSSALYFDPDDIESLLGRAWLLIERGDLSTAKTDLNRARSLASTATDGMNYLFWAYIGVGNVLLAQGDLPEALKSFRDGLAIADRLPRDAPDNLEWQYRISVSYDNIGNVLVEQGKLPEALKSFRNGLAIVEHLAKADPSNTGWQRDLSVSYDRIGGVLVAQGNLPEALNSVRDGLAIKDRLTKADPSNAQWQRDLSASYDSIGKMLAAQGNLPEALKSFHDSLSIIDHLTKADPGNAGWQRDLSVLFNKIGDVLRSQNKLSKALKSFRNVLAIRKRLAKTDPGNARWQRDLSLSFNKVGEVLVIQGKLPEALKSFRNGLAIADRLTKVDPSNTGWLRDLSVSYDRVGDVLVAQGNLQEALNLFRNGLAIIDSLAQADPDNAEWQRDVIISCVKIANLSPSEAWEMLVRALSVAVHLRDEKLLAPTDAWIPNDLAFRLFVLKHE